MANFQFNTIEGGETRSSASVELSDIEAARELATQFAGDLLKDFDGEIYSDDLSVEVANEDGLTLFVIMVHAIDAPVMTRASRPS